MKYKGVNLTEFRSGYNLAFNPPKKMLVWDTEDEACKIDSVMAIVKEKRTFPVITYDSTYAHCAEIPKAKTNWEVYAERNGITTSLSSALDVFHQRGPACIFCPAINFCRHSERICSLNFEKWAKSEYVPEDAEEK